MVYLFYTTYISVDLVHQVKCYAKVGKGGIIWCIYVHTDYFFPSEQCML